MNHREQLLAASDAARVTGGAHRWQTIVAVPIAVLLWIVILWPIIETFLP